MSVLSSDSSVLSRVVQRVVQREIALDHSKTLEFLGSNACRAFRLVRLVRLVLGVDLSGQDGIGMEGRYSYILNLKSSKKISM